MNGVGITHPLVKLHRPKAMETKTTAEVHVEAPDSSRMNRLDTPMAKDWGQTHMPSVRPMSLLDQADGG